MKKAGIIAALLALLVALAAAPALGAITTTFNDAAAPSGTHVQSGDPSCSLTGAQQPFGVSCSSYELAGVGHIDALATLSTTYSGTVVCINGGGNPSDSQHQGTFPTTTSVPLTSGKNGRLTVPSLTKSPPSTADFLALQTCPNPNWTPTVPGGITLTSFTYTLHFVGFTGNYITITGP
jgi:hypothetical protein